MNGNGKIARLPRPIREQLNQRLDENEPGGTLLAWLNGLEPVQNLLQKDFGGVPVSKQNLSEWRLGGFKRWQAQRELLDHTRELSADASELSTATDGKLSDHLATVLAARYAALLSGWDGEVTEAFTRQLRLLKGLCRDIVELRRSDQRDARLKLEAERQGWEREKTEEEVVGWFEKWLQHAEVKKVVAGPERCRSKATDGPPHPPQTGDGSNRVKPLPPG
jgi:hypothetical protein